MQRVLIGQRELFGIDQRQCAAQRAGALLAVAVFGGVADEHLRRAGIKLLKQVARKLQLALGRGMRHAQLALQLGGQQRVGRGRGRPAAIIKAQQPDRIKLHASSFQGAEHLNGGGIALWLEDGFFAQLAQAAQHFGQAHAPMHARQRRKGADGVAQFGGLLELATVRWQVARPAQGFDDAQQMPGPGIGRVVFRQLFELCLQLLQPLDQLRRMRTAQFVAVLGAVDQAEQIDLRQAIVAQHKIEHGAAIPLAGMTADKRRAQQGADLIQRNVLALHQAQGNQQVRDQRVVGQRLTKRQVESVVARLPGQHGLRVDHLGADARQLIAAFFQTRADDGDLRVWMLFDPLLGPVRGGAHFGLWVGQLQTLALAVARFGAADFYLAALRLQRIEQCLLQRVDRIETCQLQIGWAFQLALLGGCQ